MCINCAPKDAEVAALRVGLITVRPWLAGNHHAELIIDKALSAKPSPAYQSEVAALREALKKIEARVGPHNCDDESNFLCCIAHRALSAKPSPVSEAREAVYPWCFKCEASHDPRPCLDKK